MIQGFLTALGGYSQGAVEQKRYNQQLQQQQQQQEMMNQYRNDQLEQTRLANQRLTDDKLADNALNLLKVYDKQREELKNPQEGEAWLKEVSTPYAEAMLKVAGQRVLPTLPDFEARAKAKREEQITKSISYIGDRLRPRHPMAQKAVNDYMSGKGVDSIIAINDARDNANAALVAAEDKLIADKRAFIEANRENVKLIPGMDIASLVKNRFKAEEDNLARMKLQVATMPYVDFAQESYGSEQKNELARKKWTVQEANVKAQTLERLAMASYLNKSEKARVDLLRGQLSRIETLNETDQEQLQLNVNKYLLERSKFEWDKQFETKKQKEDMAYKYQNLAFSKAGGKGNRDAQMNAVNNAVAAARDDWQQAARAVISDNPEHDEETKPQRNTMYGYMDAVKFWVEAKNKEDGQTTYIYSDKGIAQWNPSPAPIPGAKPKPKPQKQTTNSSTVLPGVGISGSGNGRSSRTGGKGGGNNSKTGTGGNKTFKFTGTGT